MPQPGVLHPPSKCHENTTCTSFTVKPPLISSSALYPRPPRHPRQLKQRPVSPLPQPRRPLPTTRCCHPWWARFTAHPAPAPTFVFCSSVRSLHFEPSPASGPLSVADAPFVGAMADSIVSPPPSSPKLEGGRCCRDVLWRLSTGGNGQKVEFLTTDKVLTKFYEKFVEGKKSEYIDDDGNVIKMPGAQYDDIGVRKLY